MRGLAAAANNPQRISYFLVLVSQLVRSALLLGKKRNKRREGGQLLCKMPLVGSHLRQVLKSSFCSLAELNRWVLVIKPPLLYSMLAHES